MRIKEGEQWLSVSMGECQRRDAIQWHSHANAGSEHPKGQGKDGSYSGNTRLPAGGSSMPKQAGFTLQLDFYTLTRCCTHTV